MGGDALTAGGQTQANMSVTKPQKQSNYPNYFYNPKENLFDNKRKSRYDKGH